MKQQGLLRHFVSNAIKVFYKAPCVFFLFVNVGVYKARGHAKVEVLMGGRDPEHDPQSLLAAPTCLSAAIWPKVAPIHMVDSSLTQYSSDLYVHTVLVSVFGWKLDSCSLWEATQQNWLQRAVFLRYSINMSKYAVIPVL